MFFACLKSYNLFHVFAICLTLESVDEILWCDHSNDAPETGNKRSLGKLPVLIQIPP